MKAAIHAGPFTLNIPTRLMLAAALLTLAVDVHATEPELTAQAAVRGRLGSSILSDAQIQRAVRETLAETKENPRRHDADVLRADKWQTFSDEFHEAKVPDCLHPDGLKRQPPTLGPISFQYLFAVPFVVLAKVRGKCL